MVNLGGVAPVVPAIGQHLGMAAAITTLLAGLLGGSLALWGSSIERRHAWRREVGLRSLDAAADVVSSFNALRSTIMDARSNGAVVVPAEADLHDERKRAEARLFCHPGAGEALSRRRRELMAATIQMREALGSSERDWSAASHRQRQLTMEFTGAVAAFVEDLPAARTSRWRSRLLP